MSAKTTMRKSDMTTKTFDKIKAAERHTAHAVRNLKNAAAALLELEETLKTAEPVVHCKDCESYAGATVNSKGFTICPQTGMDITPDGYCWHGEQSATDPVRDVCKWLAEMFDPPCSFTPRDAEDEYRTCVDDVGMEDWCASHCGRNDEADCWFEVFKRMQAQKEQK